MISRNSFYKSTIANFTEADRPVKEPDYVSESGSSYWYTKKGVYRQSNHWGVISTCEWMLENGAGYLEAVGFCEWSNFSELHSLSIASINGYRCFPSYFKSKTTPTVGENISALRTYTVRGRGGYFSVHKERIQFTIAKITACFVITTSDKKYKQQTLSAAYTF